MPTRFAASSQHQQRVDEFMRRAEQDVPSIPTEPDEKTRLLRAKLIMSEALETIQLGLGIYLKLRHYAAGKIPITEELIEFSINPYKPFDMIETVDGCCDVIVVSTGTLSACGVSDIPVQEAIDESNLKKFESPRCTQCGAQTLEGEQPGVYWCNCGGSPLGGYQGPYKDADGKWQKPPDWQPPDLLSILKEQGYDPDSH